MAISNELSRLAAATLAGQLDQLIKGATTYGGGFSPLIGGLVKLFGGGSDSKPLPALVKYTAPEAVRFEGQVARQAGYTDWSGSETAQTGRPVAGSGPQITVQVNALDSKSFLDHSQEIARAVRDAMLNSHSLNDVVNDL